MPRKGQNKGKASHCLPRRISSLSRGQAGGWKSYAKRFLERTENMNTEARTVPRAHAGPLKNKQKVQRQQRQLGTAAHTWYPNTQEAKASRRFTSPKLASATWQEFVSKIKQSKPDRNKLISPPFLSPHFRVF